MEGSGIEIQIEPVIKRKPLIKYLSGTDRATCSFKATDIAFRIYNRSNVAFKKVILSYIEIHNMEFSHTLGQELSVENLKPGESKTTDAFSVFFVAPGIYWADTYLQLVLENKIEYRLILRQTDLKDKSLKASGAIRDKNKNFCRNIIPVVDLHSIRLTILTFILAVLTAGLIFLTICLIKN